MPPPITAHVATVRHSTSVLAKSQIASRQATTAIKMQALAVQNAIFVTIRGLRKPRFIIDHGIIGDWRERLSGRRELRRARSPPLIAREDGAHHRQPKCGLASCPAEGRR